MEGISVINSLRYRRQLPASLMTGAADRVG